MFFKKNYRNLSDEDLMIFIKKKDKKAFEELYNRYSKKIFYFIYKTLNHDYDKAEDFLQDVFIKIIEYPEKYNDNKKFSTWIYTLALNLCRNEYKRNKIRNDYTNNEKDKLHNAIDNINYNYDNELFNKELISILNEIDEDRKMIFILKYIDELSIKEIAEIFNCPEGTIKSRLFYVNKMLSNRLAVFNPKI